MQSAGAPASPLGNTQGNTSTQKHKQRKKRKQKKKKSPARQQKTENEGKNDTTPKMDEAKGLRDKSKLSNNYISLEQLLDASPESKRLDYSIGPIDEMMKMSDSRPPLNSTAEVILRFLEPVLESMKTIRYSDLKGNTDGLSHVFSIFRTYAAKNQEQKQQLKEELKVSQLLLPGIRLYLPAKMILEYNQMEGSDPRFPFYYCHPLFGDEVQTFGLFLDKFDTDKSVICLFVWSEWDQCVVPLANINLKPYPLCWNASIDNEVGCKAFGVKACGQCGVARYCSKQCQHEDWVRHKETCRHWNQKLQRCDILTL